MIHIPTVDGPSPLAAEIDDMARWYIAVATETPNRGRADPSRRVTPNATA
jgi:hypothetical protein